MTRYSISRQILVCKIISFSLVQFEDSPRLYFIPIEVDGEKGWLRVTEYTLDQLRERCRRPGHWRLGYFFDIDETQHLTNIRWVVEKA